MDLHGKPEEDVRRILAAYGAWLSWFRGRLDRAVQEAGGYWEDPNLDLLSVDPCLRAGHVRQLAATMSGRWPKEGAALRLKVVSFAGIHLYTGEGQRIRTRSRPRNTKTGLPMRPTKSWSETPLFGYDPDAQPYEISVLMDIDLGTKTLAAAWLTAIDWGADDKGREIHYEEEIPAPPLDGYGYGDTNADDAPKEPGSGGLGFGDLLDEEEGTG